MIGKLPKSKVMDQVASRAANTWLADQKGPCNQLFYVGKLFLAPPPLRNVPAKFSHELSYLRVG
jgi:hypothetical protein